MFYDHLAPIRSTPDFTAGRSGVMPLVKAGSGGFYSFEEKGVGGGKRTFASIEGIKIVVSMSDD